MKKKVLIVAIIILLSIFLFGIFTKINNKKNKIIEKTNTVNSSSSINKEENKNDISEISEDENNSFTTSEEETRKVISNEKENTFNSGVRQKTTTSNTTINNETTNNSKETNNTTINHPSTITPVEEKKEIIVNENHYIGIPDPNSLNYSFHHGKIDYSTFDDCYNDGFNVVAKDINDMYSYWCVEVNDENSTILGYYLYIKCHSGNCERYKN